MSRTVFENRCRAAGVWSDPDMRHVCVSQNPPAHSVIISVFGEELEATRSRKADAVEEVFFKATRLEAFTKLVVPERRDVIREHPGASFLLSFDPSQENHVSMMVTKGSDVRSFSFDARTLFLELSHSVRRAGRLLGQDPIF